MPESYAKRIRNYCERSGIDVPPGFNRHPASRYAAVDTSKVPPRLIATTWFKQADLLYYVQRHPEPGCLRLLDFKNGDGPTTILGMLPAADHTTLSPERKRALPDSASTPLSARTAELVDALFAADERETARKLLAEHCGTNLPVLSGLDPIQLERYRFAALKISQGNLTDLERAIDLAKLDWRDLLMQADFGHDTRAHERWHAEILSVAGGTS